FSLGWCLALASLFNLSGFSMEIGAILAGITLSMSPYRHEISSKMRQLRDFFIVLFFIFMGSQLSFTDVGPHVFSIIILSIFILVGNPIIVMVLMGLLGYTKRNGFLAGLTVAQVSEFSLILVTLGIKVGHLTSEVLSVITAVGLITIAGSSYMIVYSNQAYQHISKYLSIFERKGRKVDEQKHHVKSQYDIILFGYDHIGCELVESFKRMRSSFLIVDYNPEIIVELARKGVPCRYGDVNDLEMLNELNLDRTRMVISTITDFGANLFLINEVRQQNKDAIVIVVSHKIEDTLELYKLGASYVIMPRLLGGKQTSAIIEKHGLDAKKILEEKNAHIKDLESKTDIIDYT
ncbi:MAG TPA: sodium:proton exchanger, partial [Candidatus Altiarchaeales archaeon]|nr:sodium:proton exchanger [Candidatus Altiarchaeales archaeon]